MNTCETCKHEMSPFCLECDIKDKQKGRESKTRVYIAECKECNKDFYFNDKEFDKNDYLEGYMSNGEMRKLYTVKCPFCGYNTTTLLERGSQCLK